MKGTEIVVISGIRRCGKSSLLKLIAKRISGTTFYLNFDDVRLTDFTTENFQDAQNIAHELSGTTTMTYFLDEIQNVHYWERWVNTLYELKNKTFITGSNAGLLSSEIATHLTGRNKVLNLNPFSFKEYLTIKNTLPPTIMTTTEQNTMYKHFTHYLEMGGFPLIIKNDDKELSKQYFEDIIEKDIIARYTVRQSKELKDVILYLISNVGKRYSYVTLKEITGIKSLSTIKKYIDYYKNTFLLYTIQRFDYSLTKQKISSSKPYAGDTIFLTTISFEFTDNTGRKLENAVYLHLRRTGKEIYYYQEKKECDFIVKEGRMITQAIQVCANISDPTTRKREIEGLTSAMTEYNLREGCIITMETEETINIGEKIIRVIPAWKWMLE